MKQHRTLIVVAVAVVTAGLASFGVYRAIQSIPVREVEVASVEVAVAAKAIPLGTRLTAEDVRLVAWPARNQVPGAFANPTELVGRGVIEPVSENQPFTTRNVAAPEAGAGLPPVIPPGMRAMSVRVNEVIGVAGFVLPGTRVDVVVTVSDADANDARNEPMSRTVLSNVLVLTAGTRYDQEEARGGEPVRSTVVTLAVLPDDGERIALASSQGEVSLALRNPMDADPTETKGIKLANLMSGTAPAPIVEPTTRRVVRVRPPAPAAPSIYTVETIRAAKRAEEVVR